VKRLAGLGALCALEAGLGLRAGFTDEAYVAAEAQLSPDAAAAIARAKVLVKVQPPNTVEAARLAQGSVVVCMSTPSREVVAALAERSTSLFCLDRLPRISRAQSMDALSSQATVAGYWAALLAAERVGRFFPMLMTAAGTVPPARTLVLGAGVAGLQAIATARRLGAVVEAYDVRPATKQEVESLGAKFVELPLELGEGEGGYARQMTDETQKRLQDLIAQRVAAADAVITTAAVPGRPAPRIVTSLMIEGMRPGSVIVDIAASSGGNCELTRLDEEVVHSGVTIFGPSNAASMMAAPASDLFARNVTEFLTSMIHEGGLAPDFTDEVVGATCVIDRGQIMIEGA
jgi:NAD(P) transhydrogenase subunit alpha